MINKENDKKEDNNISEKINDISKFNYKCILFNTIPFIIYGSFNYFLQIFPKYILNIKQHNDKNIDKNNVNLLSVKMILYFQFLNYFWSFCGLYISEKLEKIEKNKKNNGLIKLMIFIKNNLTIISLSFIMLINFSLLFIKNLKIIYLIIILFNICSSICYIPIFEKNLKLLSLNKGTINGIINFMKVSGVILYHPLFLYHKRSNNIFFLTVQFITLILSFIVIYMERIQRIKLRNQEEYMEIKEEKRDSNIDTFLTEDFEQFNKGENDENNVNNRLSDSSFSSTNNNFRIGKMSYSKRFKRYIKKLKKHFNQRYFQLIFACFFMILGSYIFSFIYPGIAMKLKIYSPNSIINYFIYFIVVGLSSILSGLIYDYKGIRMIIAINILISLLTVIFSFLMILFKFALIIVIILSAIVYGNSSVLWLPILFKEISYSSPYRPFLFLLSFLILGICPIIAYHIIHLSGMSYIYLYMSEILGLIFEIIAGIFIYVYLYPLALFMDKNGVVKDQIKMQNMLRDMINN